MARRRSSWSGPGRRARGDRRASARRRGARPEPAGAVRLRGVPHPARPPGDAPPADHHGHGAHERGRSHRRPRHGRRLRDQALQPARTVGPRARCCGGSQGPSADVEAVYRGRQIVADFDAVSVAVDGVSVRLTRREFELLKCLVENRNRVLSRERLLEQVWGYDRLIETRSVDVHVGRLRAKLGSAGRRSRPRSVSGIASSSSGEPRFREPD